MTRLAAVLLLALVLPASAAAADWTPPEHVADLMRAYSVTAPQFTDGGSALAAITEHDRTGANGRTEITRTPAGDWTSRFVPGRRLDSVRQAVAGDGSVVLVGFRVALVGRDPLEGLAARYGRLDADGVSFDGEHVLTNEPQVHSLDVAGNPAGHVAVAWDVKDAPRARRGVFVARRRPGKPFGDVIRLSDRGAMAGTVSVAVAPDGHTVAAWRRLDTVFVRVAPPGRPFARTIEIAAADRPRGIALAADDGGRVLAAWSGQTSHRVVVARRGRSGEFHFKSFPGYYPPSVVFDTSGAALVAFNSRQGTRVATFARGAPSLQTIPGSGRPHDLVAGPGGRVALLLLSDPAPTPTAYVALRRTGEERQPTVLFHIYPDEFAQATEAYVTTRVP
jgi:hypothetical protein